MQSLGESAFRKAALGPTSRYPHVDAGFGIGIGIGMEPNNGIGNGTKQPSQPRRKVVWA